MPAETIGAVLAPGRGAVITGGASGIGLATARAGLIRSSLSRQESPYFWVLFWCRGGDLNPHVVSHGGF